MTARQLRRSMARRLSGEGRTEHADKGCGVEDDMEQGRPEDSPSQGLVDLAVVARIGLVDVSRTVATLLCRLVLLLQVVVVLNSVRSGASERHTVEERPTRLRYDVLGEAACCAGWPTRDGSGESSTLGLRPAAIATSALLERLCCAPESDQRRAGLHSRDDAPERRSAPCT